VAIFFNILRGLNDDEMTRYGSGKSLFFLLFSLGG